MRIMISVILLLMSSVDIISGTSTCQSFQISLDHLNKRLTNHSLGELTVFGHHLCAQECLSLNGCKSIDFYKTENYCKLNDVDSTAVDSMEFEHRSGYVFSDITEWPSEMSGNCVSRPCSVKQKCVSSAGTYTCVDIECSNSELEIPNGKLVLDAEGEHYFRDTAKVSCNKGYKSEVAKVLCKLQGKWETTECIETNVAFGKPAQMSSVVAPYVPENGIDGRKDTIFHTANDAVAWWLVDLGFVFEILKVSLFNRADCCQDRANGLELYVGKTQDTMVQICSIETFTEILKAIYPPAGTEARYVLLELRTYMPLHLAEVEVQGEPAEEINVAVGKTTESSSLFSSWLPEYGVDGNRASLFGTMNEAVAWWRVDLGHLFEIVNVSIYNRVDCCQERANGLEVEVGITLNSMVLISKIETFTELSKTIYPPECTEARYVSLTIRTGQHLHLAEVEVQGKPAL